MRRREFIASLGGAALAPMLRPSEVHAQQQPPLVGILNSASADATAPHYQAFHGAMRSLGYVEDRTIRYTYRFADGFIERLPALAAELVALKPQLIVSAPLPATLSLHNITTTIPIVMASGADPVGFGLVESLARPGGNVTGLTNFAEELASKQLDLIRELLPRLTRVAALVNVDNPLHVPQLRETKTAAANASLALIPFEFRKPDDFETAFATFAQERADALLVPPDTTFSTHRVLIATLAARARLPTIFGNRQMLDGGGLMSYGPDPVENYRRAATFVDKILKGAKPGELPVERPTRIELVINRKAARELNLSVPPMLLARADEVIE